MALSICLPVEAWPPVSGTIRPILTVSSAFAALNAPATKVAAATTDNVEWIRNLIAVPPRTTFESRAVAPAFAHTLVEFFNPHSWPDVEQSACGDGLLG